MRLRFEYLFDFMSIRCPLGHSQVVPGCRTGSGDDERRRHAARCTRGPMHTRPDDTRPDALAARCIQDARTLATHGAAHARESPSARQVLPLHAAAAAAKL